jgi:hypothetical protein
MDEWMNGFGSQKFFIFIALDLVHTEKYMMEFHTLSLMVFCVRFLFPPPELRFPYSIGQWIISFSVSFL